MKKESIYMSYKNNVHLNEADTSSMTAAQLAKAGITSIKGYGGESIPINKAGFLEDPANHLPDGLLDKLKGAWQSSDGDVSKFYAQDIDGTSVKNILSQCPSQQSFGIAKAVGLPNGTDVPCHQFTNHGYTAIKYGTGSSALTDTAAGNTGVVGGVTDGGTGTTGGIDGGSTGTTDGGSIGSGAGDWWSFFGTKEFLIGAAVFAGVVAAIKAMGNTIKARFRKCAKVIYNMQKDFGTSENGMDMKAVLPGVGSKIMDKIAQLWGRKKGTGAEKGALGLRPFVDNYRNEIAGDLAEAKKAYNLIKAAGDSSTSGVMNNHEKPAQPEIEPKDESISESKIYESFEDALKSSKLNEEESNVLNEVGIGTALMAGSLLIKGLSLAKGAFSFKSKDEQGNIVTKQVQVTPKSNREICYSIINMFYSKYFDLERVFKGLGIDDLSEVDASNVAKFEKIVKMSSEEVGEGSKSKMFKRVQNNYNKMVDSYLRVGKGVVNNFEKFTKSAAGGKEGLSEKDSNLLTAATEKLRAEMNRQEDGYKNNFPRVMNAIISSPEYVEFTNLIIEKILPVFKTGTAGDADYILDVVPKADEFYVLRQTNEQAGLDSSTAAKGNVVLCKVNEFNKERKTISFTKVGLLKADLTRTDKGTYDMSNYGNENIDRTAFSNNANSEEGSSETIEYGKWLALDPIIAEGVNDIGGKNTDDPEDIIEVIKRDKDTVVVGRKNPGEQDPTEFVFIAPRRVSDKADIINKSESETKKEFEEDKLINEDETNSENKETTAEDNNTNGSTVLFLQTDKDGNTISCYVASSDNDVNTVKAALDSEKEKRQEELIKSDVKIEDVDNKEKAIENLDKLDKNKEKDAESQEKIIDDFLRLGKSEQEEQTNLPVPTSNNLPKVPVIYEIGTKLLSASNEDEFKSIVQAAGNTVDITTKTGINALGWQIGSIEGSNTGIYLVFFFNKEQNNYDVGILELSANGDQKVICNGREEVKEYLEKLNTANNIMTQELQNAKTKNPDNKNIQEIEDAVLIIEPEDVKTGKDSAPTSNWVRPRWPNGQFMKKEDFEKIMKSVEQKPKEEPAPQNASYHIEYSKLFNLAESFMGTLSYLKVHRNISIDSNDTYYVLSENAWGDGSVRNPIDYLKNRINESDKFNTYDDFARYAKSSVSINFIPVNEEEYKTVLPYNRYQMLTESNPLYESLVFVSFDNTEDRKVKNIIKVDEIQKIVG